jgi:hypothetical protein
MTAEVLEEKLALISREAYIPSHELETGEIDPQVEKELREYGLTDEYFRRRKAGILEVKEMSKRPLSCEMMWTQMLKHKIDIL